MAEERFTAEEWGRRMAKARARSLTANQRKDIAKAAINARWEKYYAAHPEKLKAKLEKERTAKRKASSTSSKPKTGNS
jgi:hypothetical protein